MNSVQSVSVAIGQRMVSMSRIPGPYGPLYLIKRDQQHECMHDDPTAARTLFAWAIRDARAELQKEVAA